jgi:D-tyrosyl-tRNA(Tyr) deacylase
VRAVVQRVRQAAVRVDGAAVGEIGAGLCILLSVGPEDTEAVADRLAGRIATIRICADTSGKMNHSLLDTGGAALVVSQFTLHADTSRGHRPSFIGASPPDLARRLYQRFIEALQRLGVTVATGEFGAGMTVEIHNEGPVTLVISSGEPAWAADAG